ncbi:MAG: glutathione S-transferase family protein [Inquilinus sp.]|nr:glutathione S-transferase family protein [Inquilinus sp.]
MLEIWGRRNASNVMPVMWAVGELGIEYVRHDVGGSFGGLDTPAFLALNPNGTIPVIEDDGFVLWESNTIVRFLCRRHGHGTLRPESDQACAVADQWMEWFKSTAYRPYIDLFWAIIRTEPARRDRQRIAALTETLNGALGRLEGRLAESDYLAGDTFTMADIPYGPLLYRYFTLDIERPRLPKLAEWYERLSGRPAFQDHVMLPFGTDPEAWLRLERQGAAGGVGR